MKLKITLTILTLALLAFLTGCLPSSTAGVLTLFAPDSAYPPCEVTLIAQGVIGGQYTFTVEGKTYTQNGNSFTVTIEDLPCTVEVLWESESGEFQIAKAWIGLTNTGPYIGTPVLNGIANLWWIHPKGRYIVTFPDAQDFEGGDVRLVNVTVYNTGQKTENSVFCTPNPAVYNTTLDTGEVLENAFMFFSMWNGKIDAIINDYDEWEDLIDYYLGDKVQLELVGYRCIKDIDYSEDGTRKPVVNFNYWEKIGPVEAGSSLPYSPPDRGVAGYPGAGLACLSWNKNFIPSGDTVITATFEDERGATTTESWSIPTTSYPGC